MKEDAFEDVRCPFNYKRELRKVRRALDAKVGEYRYNNPWRSYRALSNDFNLSPGTLCGMARGYERRDMKEDAFEDVQCPFNYKREIRKARRALDAKVGEYISKNPKRSYRMLSKDFNLSSGTLCGVARRYERRTGAVQRRRDKRVRGWWSGRMLDTQIRRHPTWLMPGSRGKS